MGLANPGVARSAIATSLAAVALMVPIGAAVSAHENAETVTAHEPSSKPLRNHGEPVSWIGAESPVLAGGLEEAPIGLVDDSVVAPSMRPLLVVEEIALRGDPAPGFGEPMFFADFGTHPQIEILFGPGDVPARMDTDGDIVFHAYATPDGGLGECPAFGECVPHGLFRIAGDLVSVVALAGDVEPTTQETFLGFPEPLPWTPDVADGRVTFLGMVGQDIFSNYQHGVFTLQDESIVPLVLTGETILPGMPRDAALDESVYHEIQGGDVYFLASFVTNMLPTEFRPEGLWRFRDGEAEAIAVAGLPAPDLPEGIFFGDTDELNIYGTIGTFDSSTSGRVVYSALIRGPGLTVAADEAIWLETDSGFEVLVAEGDLVPEGLFAAGSTFSGGDIIEGSFVHENSPRIRMNQAGKVVFYSQVDVPGDPPRVPTLWSHDNGSLELVFRGRQRGVAFSVPGEPAPGVPNGHFFWASAIETDEAGAVYIQAFAETNDNYFEDTLGIWVKREDSWEPIAFEEGPVPDLPGVTFLPRIGNIRGIGGFQIDAEGTVVYTGRFLDEGSPTFGVFRHNPDGSGNMLFKPGDPLNVGGEGEDIRIVTGFRFGAGASASGDRVLEMSFADGSRGIFTLAARAATDLAGIVPDGEQWAGPPLTVAPGDFDDLELNWGDSCLPTDFDYAVYEGTVGDFASHVPFTCTTDGATTATISPSSGNTYYLVVPNNASKEGSYGVNSDLGQRPVAIGACFPQGIGACF